MEWLRRMFGYSDKFGSEHKPYKNPTWEEIFENRNFDDRPQAPNNPFRDFHMGETYSFDMGGYEDSFSSVFGQMDDMFRQLDSIMQNFHGYQENVFITDSPDFNSPSESQSPRDSFLKKPDGGSGNDNSSKLHGPYPPPIFNIPSITKPDQGSDDLDIGHDDMDPVIEYDMRDPFNMVEDFIKSFGGVFGMAPFGENRGVPMLPGPARKPDESPRDAFVKKEDTDLDNRITGDFSNLLKDMPKYDPPVIPGQPSTSGPESLQPQPRIQQRYHSTSIVRIRRPDGSVEETRKYTDSSGREEVIVTHTQPQDGTPAGSLLHPVNICT
ncbi:HCLS1-associated protein X-1-like isoform X2 [Palaemon carinicauda]|uniref:HCLS1-associated protein X-1-like isoform X2 n=1 Tax=Palaemon carinicauda TaxID=392227 RepID=UPI0035B64A57